MELAIVGLGKMGANMARRLRRGGHRVVGFDLDVATTNKLAKDAGIVPAESIEDAVAALKQSRRVVWMMVPAGAPTQNVVDALVELLAEGDIVVDGGNSHYKDTLRRAEQAHERGLCYVDVGTSGGIWGLEEGYGMMVGGEPDPVGFITKILETLAPGPDRGWGHVGPNGAGHFVKMVHNGIEYGLMQAYAEGFELLRAKQEFDLDLHQVAEVWRFGTVIRSWLLDLTARALKGDPSLAEIAGWVDDSGEGRWTVNEAVDLAVPVPVITVSLMNRFTSRQHDSYSARLLAAMRHQFGGHKVKKS